MASATAQAPATVGQLTAAKDLMALTHAEDSTRSVANRTMPRVVEEMKKQSAEFAAHEAAFQTAYAQELEKGLPLALEIEASIYAQHYSEDELRQLIAFYKTPLGQKMLTEGGRLTAELDTAARIWATGAGVRAIQAVMPAEQTKGEKQ